MSATVVINNRHTEAKFNPSQPSEALKSLRDYYAGEADRVRKEIERLENTIVAKSAALATYEEARDRYSAAFAASTLLDETHEPVPLDGDGDGWG